MRGMGRLWQAAGTVNSILRPGLLEKAVACGLRSLFVGFETLNEDALRAQHKVQNLHRDYGAAIRRLHDLGVMVNGSFVFGMDEDGPAVFDRTVEWAVSRASGPRPSTSTPYPAPRSTREWSRRDAAPSRLGRYDTQHVVFRTRGMSEEQLEAGTGAPIAISTAGDRSCAPPPPSRP